MYRDRDYDIVVIGAGHAGCEAALAGARLGYSTCLFTINLDTIAQMSCNPAIGGLAKGHLVREIDALGGEMAKVTDRAGIQFRMLNMSKGPAVWSLRAQADRVLYKLVMRKVLEQQEHLDIKQAMAEKIVTENGEVKGVLTSLGVFYGARAVIVTTGTFLKGLIHIGLENFSAGRAGEFPSNGLSESLGSLGLKIGRLKTGTPPRLDARTIDFSKTEPQYGDEPPLPFSHSTDKITNPQLPCFITYTNAQTHKIILESLDRSPLYSGKIKGIGARYCPSIEDKVVRFAERDRHQVFLEPEGLETKEYYANGIPTSLPYDVQVKFVRTIPGLEEVEIMRPGYAIEYDFVYPTQLKQTLETKIIGGLFLAGQINGTSGYEEAAAQGLMAVINAALKLRGREPFLLGRHEAYTGVLIDDLTTKGTSEPYRMFTSRAELRLLFRIDNADERLTPLGREIGLVDDARWARFRGKYASLARLQAYIREKTVNRSTPGWDGLPEAVRAAAGDGKALAHLVKMPEIRLRDLRPVLEGDGMAVHPLLLDQAEHDCKYAGYIRLQSQDLERLARRKALTIPPGFDFESIPSLSREMRDRLRRYRPASLLEAESIPGFTPAALTALYLSLEVLHHAPGKGPGAPAQEASE